MGVEYVYPLILPQSWYDNIAISELQYRHAQAVRYLQMLTAFKLQASSQVACGGRRSLLHMDACMVAGNGRRCGGKRLPIRWSHSGALLEVPRSRAAQRGFSAKDRHFGRAGPCDGQAATSEPSEAPNVRLERLPLSLQPPSSLPTTTTTTTTAATDSLSTITLS